MELILIRMTGGCSRSVPVVRGEPLSLFGRFEDLERTHEGFVDRHHRSGVIEFTTIIRCGKNRDQLSPCEELVPIFDDLMRADDQIQIVFVQERRHDVLTERKGHTPIIFTPSIDFLIGIRPDQITQETGIGDVRGTCNSRNLLQVGQFRT